MLGKGVYEMAKKLQHFFLKNGEEGLARNAEQIQENAYQTSMKSKTQLSITFYNFLCFPMFDFHNSSRCTRHYKRGVE